MSEFDDLINAGMQAVEGQKPSTITIGTATYAGTFSDVSEEDMVGPGGFTEETEAYFILRKALCHDKPMNNISVEVVQYTSTGEIRKKFKTEKIVDDDPTWHINLKGPRK